ncbi:MAG: nucleoside monophosphate kinase [Candidatus Woesearchaeota archaeon]
MNNNHIILLGMPGSGKKTQALELQRQAGYNHISLQDTIDSRSSGNRNDSPHITHSYPDDILSTSIESLIAGYNGSPLVLEGYPNNLMQAQYLEGIIPNPIIMHLDVKKALAVDRLIKEHEGNDSIIDIVNMKMQYYNDNTMTLIRWYRLKGKEYYRVDANNPIDRVHQDIMRLIG